MQGIHKHNPDSRNPDLLYPKNIKLLVPRNWQVESFELGKDELFYLISAAGGSGKSKLVVLLSSYSIIKRGFKNLIVVPQQHQYKGFVKSGEYSSIPLMLDGIEYDWKIIDKNFCEPTAQKVQQLKKWLLTPFEELRGNDPTIIQDVNAICTSSCLTFAWSELEKEGKCIEAIYNTMFRFDEGQHLKNVFVNNDLEEYDERYRKQLEQEATQLGNIASFIMQNGNGKSGITITTATPFRNKGTWLCPKAFDLFEVYILDFIEHWKHLGIDDFWIEYHEYKGKDPIKDIIANIKKEPNEKHAVVFPSTRSRWRIDESFLNKFIKLFRKECPELRLLDVISVDLQQENKKILLNEPEIKSNDNPSKVDVVLMCMLGREGTDWCPCSRLHHGAIEGSKVLSSQTMFRLFRSYEGKTNIKLTYYIKEFHSITKREDLSDRTNALLVLLYEDDLMDSFEMPTLPDQNNGIKKERLTLAGYFGNDVFDKIMEKGINEYHLLNEPTFDNVQEIAKKICEEYGVNNPVIEDRIARRILRFAVPTEFQDKLDLHNMDIAWIREQGFDKIIKLNKNLYGANFTEKEYRVLREIIRGEWEMHFNELVAFKEKSGHCNPLVTTKLGQWCGNQRNFYKKNQLSPEKIKKLESIGFIWDIHDESWNNSYNELIVFKEKYGHCDAPYSHELGKWCIKQRTSYNNGSLSPERIEKLNKIGFIWDIRDDIWIKKYELLVVFKKENQHLDVPYGSELGHWCNTQRSFYRDNILPQDRIDKLNDIGFVWELQSTRWDNKFQMLVEFQKENGNCDAPINTELGKWCSMQRTGYRQNKLSIEKIKKLESIGFKWDVPDGIWNENLELLITFIKKHKHSDVPANTELGSWCFTQRRKYNNNKLPIDQIKKLEAIGFQWNSIHDRQWNSKYQELVKFEKENGHCDAPKTQNNKDESLGGWCSIQRTKYKKHQLSADQIKKLEAIGFRWETHNDNWNTFFNELEQFEAKHKHCDVPWDKDSPLSIWVSKQRVKYNKGTLSKERIKKLESIGFKWNVKYKMEDYVVEVKELLKNKCIISFTNLNKIGKKHLYHMISRHPEQFRFLKGKCNIQSVNDLK